MSFSTDDARTLMTVGFGLASTVFARRRGPQLALSLLSLAVASASFGGDRSEDAEADGEGEAEGGTMERLHPPRLRTVWA